MPEKGALAFEAVAGRVHDLIAPVTRRDKCERVTDLHVIAPLPQKA